MKNFWSNDTIGSCSVSITTILQLCKVFYFILLSSFNNLISEHAYNLESNVYICLHLHVLDNINLINTIINNKNDEETFITQSVLHCYLLAMHLCPFFLMSSSALQHINLIYRAFISLLCATCSSWRVPGLGLDLRIILL